MTTIGLGLEYAIHDGEGPGVFQTLAQVHDITPPNQQSDDVEVTHYQSTAREYIQGLTEPGEATFAINWVPNNATEQIILALKQSGDVRHHRITWPNGVAWTFDGYVKGFEPTAPIDDRMTATVTVKVSGATTITPAPAP